MTDILCKLNNDFNRKNYEETFEQIENLRKITNNVIINIC